MRNDYETNYLAHHGILGMKWGIRKYQNPDGTLTAAGKLRYNADGSKKTRKERRDAVKKAKAQKKALEKARQARVEKKKQEQLEKEFQEKKTKILKSGKASEVAKYKGQMTNQELSEALNRIRWEADLDKLSASETKSGFDKIDSYMSKAKTIKNWVDTGMDVYDTFATLYNFSHPDDPKRYMKKGNKEKKKDKDDD